MTCTCEYPIVRGYDKEYCIRCNKFMKNMKERPILFSTHMVQALLRGEKTQTRRIIKYKKKITDPMIGFTCFTDKGEFAVRGTHENGEYGESIFKMPYQVGDILWVRETFMYDYTPDGIIYKADVDEQSAKHMNWKPSIFMPKSACRIKLEITNIRVERVQDISETDSMAEGIQIFTKDNIVFKHGLNGWNWQDMPRTAKEAYQTLWESINGKESWSSNPYVWVIEFRRVM